LVQKTPPVCLGNSASSDQISDVPERRPSRRKLEWQQVNSATWRLIDPDGRQVQQQACHGFWGGYNYPRALAYVFDAGIGNRDWRVRIRKRGGGWAALGCVIDVDLAKRIAQQAVENPSEPKPSKFTTPSNLLGGYRWDAPALDSPTRAYIRDVEIGAVKVESPNEQPEASADDESINLCATDDEVDLQRIRDLADEAMDEAWIDWPPDDDGAA
jgi:hypothetical protein